MSRTRRPRGLRGLHPRASVAAGPNVVEEEVARARVGRASQEDQDAAGLPALGTSHGHERVAVARGPRRHVREHGPLDAVAGAPHVARDRRIERHAAREIQRARQHGRGVRVPSRERGVRDQLRGVGAHGVAPRGGGGARERLKSPDVREEEERRMLREKTPAGAPDRAGLVRSSLVASDHQHSVLELDGHVTHAGRQRLAAAGRGRHLRGRPRGPARCRRCRGSVERERDQPMHGVVGHDARAGLRPPRGRASHAERTARVHHADAERDSHSDVGRHGVRREHEGVPLRAEVGQPARREEQSVRSPHRLDRDRERLLGRLVRRAHREVREEERHLRRERERPHVEVRRCQVEVRRVVDARHGDGEVVGGRGHARRLAPAVVGERHRERRAPERLLLESEHQRPVHRNVRQHLEQRRGGAHVHRFHREQTLLHGARLGRARLCQHREYVPREVARVHRERPADLVRVPHLDHRREPSAFMAEVVGDGDARDGCAARVGRGVALDAPRVRVDQ
mmetsp:Transcript_44412/g.105429  ORF Transcript_44412/g.105429 Transcript_44412/m.105429 type:complete len:512 (-) Transcript_44412:1249-2784(-)